MLYGRLAESAIAAVGLLAEVYDEGATLLSAERIAAARGLPAPTVAKVMAALSNAGVVAGRRGPGGGFRLARAPAQIRIYDVWSIFEREETRTVCPFGGGLCGQGENCPLHDDTATVREALSHFLMQTTFEKFRAAAQECGWRSQTPPPIAPDADAES